LVETHIPNCNFQHLLGSAFGHAAIQSVTLKALEDLHAGLIRSTILGTIAIRSNLVHPKLFRQKVLAWNFFTNRPPVIACVVRTGIKPPVAVDSFQYIFRPLNVYARKAGVA
jgi:hypothetical protein